MRSTILHTIKYFTVGSLTILWLSARCNVRAPLKGDQSIVKKEITSQKKEVTPEVAAPPQSTLARLEAYYQKVRDSSLRYDLFKLPRSPYLDLPGIEPLRLSRDNYLLLLLKYPKEVIQPQQSPAVWELIDPRDGSKIYLCGTMHYINDYHDTTILDRALKALKLSDYFTAESYGGNPNIKIHEATLKAIDHWEKNP